VTSRTAILVAILWLLGALSPGAVRAQEDDYVQDESQRLQIRVHIIGEVKEPGEYLVHDNTDVLELISKAGGPTEFGNLSRVRIRRVEPSSDIFGGLGTNGSSGDEPYERLLRTDITAYLNAQSESPPPLLYPGDVVTVPSNSWRMWRRMFSMVRDIAVVASVYLLYLRIN
jgi:hypothetical protein